MCSHKPPCPSSDHTDRDAARVVASHPQQGWSLLCNGVVRFSDGGALLPDGTAVPARPAPAPPLAAHRAQPVPVAA